MDERLRGLLEELHRQGLAHDRGRADRLERLRNLEPETASVLAVLVRATSARRVLELGTSNGYSTLWLADGVASLGGGVVSVESDPDRSALAAANLRRAGLDGTVELRIQDAGVALCDSGDGAWDMIFLDAERSAYAGYWEDLVRALKPCGLLAVDNVLSHAAELEEFRAMVLADPRVSEAVVPTGAGLLLVVRDPPADARDS